MTRPTPAERQAMRERCDKATDGPWTIRHRCVGCTEDDDESCGLGLEIEQLEEPMRGTYSLAADAKFIAHARTDLPALLDALDEAEQEIARLKLLVAWMQGWLDENQAMTATGMARLALRDWRREIGRQGAALVRAAGEGKE